MATRNIELSEDEDRLLEEVAAEQKRSVSELIRQGVVEVLRIEGRLSREEMRLRAAALSGRFRSGLPDLSAEHDHYLEEPLER